MWLGTQIGRIALIPLVSILGSIFIISEAVQAVPNGGYARPEVLIQPEELKALANKKNPISESSIYVRR